MLQFNIGLSAIQIAEQGLAISGNNLANANTPGYHVQSADLASNITTPVGHVQIGTGASIVNVNRAVNDQLDAAVNLQASQSAFTDASLTASTQIEQTISAGATSPSTQLENFLNSLQQLSSAPTSGAAQQAAVSSAQTVAVSFNTAADDLSQIQSGLDSSIGADVQQINSLATQIANLNQKISTVPDVQGSNNNLLDQRSELVNNLAKLTDIQVSNQTDGTISITAGGGPLVTSNQANTLTVGTDKSGNTTVSITGYNQPLSIGGGDLGGLLSQRNGTLVDIQNRLDTMAKQVAASFNAVQSTGLGGSGGFTQLTGKNGVSSPTALLNSAGLSFPPQAGTLYIGVTNTATGQRTITGVAIDPQTQSLQDVANAINSAVPQAQAYINTQSGTMTISASPGYTFDFTGGYQATPSTNFAGGSSVTPTIGGTYTGTNNDNYTVTFTSNGIVGVTSGLQAQVTNQAGTVIGTVNVGQGYQAGQPITLANGLTMTLSAGTAVAGDSFSTPVVANSDSGGILPALGLNTLFTGDSAATLSVNSDIVANPSLLATSTTGQAADTSNLQRFAALGNAQVLNNGAQSFSQYADQMVSDMGTAVQSLTSQQSTNQTLTASLTAQQQSVEGVDTNQELANVMQYQQMFEMASKYISAVNDAMQSLLTNINL